MVCFLGVKSAFIADKVGDVSLEVNNNNAENVKFYETVVVWVGMGP